MGAEIVADAAGAGAEGATKAGEGGVAVGGGAVFDIVNSEDLESFEEGREGDLERGRVYAVGGVGK